MEKVIKIPWFISLMDSMIIFNNPIQRYIEKQIDKQLDNPQLDKFINSLREPELMPSCIPFYTFIEQKLGLTERQILDLKEEYESVYLKEYRKQLREWWFKKHSNYIINNRGEVLFVNGIPERKDHKYIKGIDPNNDIVDESQINGFNLISDRLNASTTL